MEWAAVADGLVVVASEERAWLHRPLLGGVGDPFSEPMTGAGSLHSTHQLLEGAFLAGERAAPPPGPAEPLTATRWVWRLAWQYHTSHSTPRLLLEARDRFATLGRHDLAENCAQKADEEAGHDALALRDLRDMDYDAEAVVEVFRPPTAGVLVDYFAASVRSDEPVRCFGYAYALERSTLRVGKDYIDAVEAILPPAVRATRCLRVHSAVGSDAHHVAEAVEFIAGLPAADRAAIARACFETARIMRTLRPGDDPPEAELASTLAGVGGGIAQ